MERRERRERKKKKMSCVLSWHTKSMRMLQNDENAKQKIIKQIERERKMMGQRNGGQRTRGSDSRERCEE